MKICIHQFSLYFFLVLSILLNACNMVEPAHPTLTAPLDEPQATGPVEGTLMAWVDGSSLIYIDFCKLSSVGDCGIPDFRWVYRSEVTNYQFALCVESGTCLLPYIDAPAYDDPDKYNSPAQIIGPEGKQAYCTWAGGRLLTEEESADVVASGGESLTGILIGLLSPGTENGIRCIVDAPGPMAAACQTSSFYLNGAPTQSDNTVTQAGQFCQKGIGYVTLDINLPEGASLQSVNGDCEVVGGNRVLCTSQSGLISDGTAIILGGLLPFIEPEGLPAAGQMQCLPGYEPNSDSPAQCDFNKLLPYINTDSKATINRETEFARKVSLVVFQPYSMQTRSQQQICPKPLSFSERLGRCVFDIPAEDLARAGRNPGTSPTFWNPLEGYPPPNEDGTCPEGSTLFNDLYCIPNEDDGGPYGFGNPARPWNPLRGYPPANADGTCPEGTTLLYSHCIPGEPPPSEDESDPLDFELQPPYWNPFLGYPPANADGTCPEGSTNFYGFCIPDEPAPGEEEDGAGWGFGWDPITGYPPRNADGTCPEGTTLFLDLYCLPNAAARGEGGTDLPSFGINWDPLGGFPLPSAFGTCPEGTALINGRCLPSEPPPTGSEGLAGSNTWNPLAGYPSTNASGICPDGSTLISGHCIPSEPAPSDDPRCMAGYWFDETLGVCLPDIIFGCPVGTYFDKYERLCIASGVPTSLTLPGFHFDEGAQCSLTDLPSGRYPGCPDGQAYDPSTGSCDIKNTYVEDGKVLSTVEFNFSAPFCEVNNSSGGDEGSVSVDCSQYTTNSTCTAAGCSYDYILKVCK